MDIQKIKNYFGTNVIYDNMGQYIWAVDGHGGHQKVADLRGWGVIQNLFKNKGGEVDFEAAAKFQDEIGAFICVAIKEKLKHLESLNPL